MNLIRKYKNWRARKNLSEATIDKEGIVVEPDEEISLTEIGEFLLVGLKFLDEIIAANKIDKKEK